MKILIISHYYKHKNAMASIRPIKLAKYFSQFGHEVTELTSLQKDNWCQQELNPTFSTDLREIYAVPHWGMKYLTKLYDKLRKRGLKKIWPIRARTWPFQKSKILENQQPSKLALKALFHGHFTILPTDLKIIFCHKVSLMQRNRKN